MRKSKETKLKMSLARKKWYLNNPEKVKEKSAKMQITKILEGTHTGNRNSNFGSGKFRGKPFRGKIWSKGLTKENSPTLMELSIQNLAEKNPYWKGDRVGLSPLHQWIGKRKVKPSLCENCKKSMPYDLANISGKYKRDVNDFKWLCRKCHMESDGRLFNLKNYKGVRN